MVWRILYLTHGQAWYHSSSMQEIEERVSQGGIMFSGEPATPEAIDDLIRGMKMGLLYALETQKKKSK